MKLQKKKDLLQKRRWRIRKKVNGTAERPRLALRFTNKHMHAQCIDDVFGQTLVYLSTISVEPSHSPNVEGAKAFGQLFGAKAKDAGIQQIVFDRAGRKYHGRVQAFADAVRKNGIKL